MAAIIEAAEDGIISKNLSGVVTSWNPAAEQIFGYRAEEMIGQSILRVIPAELAWEEEMILNNIRNGAHMRNYETRRLTKYGASITIALTVSPIHDVHGNVIGVSKIVRDISAQKELERTVERAKDQFLSNVSHELRTPLTSIRGALKLLERIGLKVEDPRSVSLLRIANDNSERLLRVVDELLDFQRLNAGTTVHVRSCRLSDIIPPAIESISSFAEARGIQLLSSSTEVSGDTVLKADPDRLRQVLHKLLSNAPKYSPPGSKVEVAASREASSLVIRVGDEGRGIPGVLLEKIFEQFEQVDKIDARDETGVGLGLAISRSIIEQHGGVVWAERNDSSTPGAAGSTFALRLPL